MSSLVAGPAPRSIIDLGMDVHKDSITIAVLAALAKAPTRMDKLPNDLPKLKKWMERVARDGEIQACYEASGAGYVLHRALRDWGYACAVIALYPTRTERKRLTRLKCNDGCRESAFKSAKFLPASSRT